MYRDLTTDKTFEFISHNRDFEISYLEGCSNIDRGI